MGTSRSKPDSGSGSSLVPPWSEREPAPPPPSPENPDMPSTLEIKAVPSELSPPRRYAGFRTRLSRFAATGNFGEARAAMGHWIRTASGGAGTAARKMARAARTAGSVLAGLARAGTNSEPERGAFDIRLLAGLKTEEAIDRIVDAFCEPGILDENVVRIAIGEAIAASQSDSETFDPSVFNADVIREAILAFVAEIVFVTVSADSKDSLKAAPSLDAAVQRESDLRSLIHEAADQVGAPLIDAAGTTMTKTAMSRIVAKVVFAVHTEISTW